MTSHRENAESWASYAGGDGNYNAAQALAYATLVLADEARTANLITWFFWLDAGAGAPGALREQIEARLGLTPPPP